jgi:Restriction endonuclease
MPFVFLIFIVVVIVCWAIGKVSGYLQQKNIAKIEDVRRGKIEIEEAKKKIEIMKIEIETDREESEKKIEAMKVQIKEDKEAIEMISKEKSKGFPWLAQAYADYFHLQQLKEAEYLERKSRPAPVSAERVRAIARERRTIEEKLRIAQAIINYYQELFPFLEEFLGEPENEILQYILSRNIGEPIKEVDEIGIDPVRIYLSSLSEEEYQKLSTIERNQLALDRYWNKPKSNWQLGRDYERYIGYLYEINGYYVYYQGILEGYDDMGRDLIAKKGEETVVVQCKRWSQYKTIHEKHVSQLYGTHVKYIIDHPNEKVNALLCTTTILSDRAKEFAKHLGIGIVEKFPLQKYRSIKCNISRRSDEKICHLPFDQQYDRTLIEEERNECYVETVEEAENLGYRRAWRWRGQKSE